MRKQISNLTPYTDNYFINCIYIEYLSAIKALGGDINGIISNTTFHNLLIQNGEEYALFVIDAPKIPLIQSMNECGIAFQREYIKQEDFVSYIEEQIDHNRIPIIAADGMYYRHPFHDLFYMKAHHIQSFVVSAYDSDQRIFEIVDVNGFKFDTHDFCYSNQVSYEDLTTCHIKSYETEQRYYNDGITVLSRMNEDLPVYSKEDQKHRLISTILADKKNILEGLEKIKWIADHIELYHEDADDSFNNKIARSSMVYQYDMIFGEEWSKYIELWKKSYKEWDTVDLAIQKNKILNQNIKQRFVDRFKKIYEIESQIYESIFDTYQ